MSEDERPVSPPEPEVVAGVDPAPTPAAAARRPAASMWGWAALIAGVTALPFMFNPVLGVLAIFLARLETPKGAAASRPAYAGLVFGWICVGFWLTIVTIFCLMILWLGWDTTVHMVVPSTPNEGEVSL